MMKPILELRDVTKSYALGHITVHALRKVSLKIFPAEFIVIIGPSGSGKSTLMNMIGALDIPTMGNIFLEGKDIAKMHESDLAQIRGRKVGFVFQQFNLIPQLTAIGNVMLPMIFQGVTPDQRVKRAESILDAVGLKKRMHHRPNELSGGERQRVAISRALANDPSFVLADEPTGNLDSKTGEDIMDLFVNLRRKGKTIIMVTHDPSLIKFGDRIIKIKDGLISEVKK